LRNTRRERSWGERYDRVACHLREDVGLYNYYMHLKTITAADYKFTCEQLNITRYVGLSIKNATY